MTSPFKLATRFIGIAEIPGTANNPAVQWGFSLCKGFGPETPDEVPWCSAWAQIPAFLAGVERSESAAARSWLEVGTPVPLDEASIGWDIVVLSRGSNPAQGHVGYYAGRTPTGDVLLLGGNQNDRVSVAAFPAARVLGVRRLRSEVE